MDRRKLLFEQAPPWRALMTLALPTIGSQLITIVYNLADSFYIGSTNDPYKVAAVSLTFVLMFVMNSLANLFGIGGGSLVSRLMGSGRYEDAAKVSAFSFYGAMLVALLLSGYIWFFADPILRVLGASEATLPDARAYSIWVVAAGGIPTVLSLTLSHLLRSDGFAVYASVGLGLGGVLNIILDPLFMFVLLEPGHEVAGAAIATAISNLVVFVFFLVCFVSLRGRTVLSLSPTKGLPSGGLIKEIFSVGLPSCLSSLLACSSTMILNRLCAFYGDIPVASAGLVKKIDMLPMNVTMGICQGMIPLVAYNYASGNYARMKKIISAARVAGIGFSGLCTATFLLFAEQIVMFFIREQATVSMGAAFLRITCLAVPFMACNVQMGYTFQAVGDGRSALILACCRQGLVNIPLMFAMNAVFGLYGLIWTQFLADSLVVLISLFLYRRMEKSLILSKE